MLQTNAKVFPTSSHWVCPWVSDFLIHGLICTALYVYANAMSVCVISFILTWPVQMLFNFVSSNTGKFRMEKMLSSYWRSRQHPYCTYNIEMSWKRRLFVGTLRYYTLHISLCLPFFGSHSVFGVPQVNFNSFWLCSCSTTHVNANEILENGEGDEMQKKNWLNISWLQNIQYTYF